MSRGLYVYNQWAGSTFTLTKSMPGSQVPQAHEWVFGTSARFLLPLYFLWDLLGYSFLIGAGVAAIIIVGTTGFAQPKIQHHISEYEGSGDKRVSFISEVVKAIETVKGLNLEPWIEKVVTEKRAVQMQYQKRFWHWGLIMWFGNDVAAAICFVAVFGSYVAFGNELKLSTALTAQMWLQMLLWGALGNLPYILQQVSHQNFVLLIPSRRFLCLL